MKVKNLPPEVRHIWKVAMVVQGAIGLTTGLSLFIYGPLLYEKLTSLSDPKLALTLVALLIGVGQGLCVLLEVPTGAIGDSLGRKWTVVTSFVARLMQNLFLAFIPLLDSFPFVIGLALLAVVSFSFTYTFFSGTFTAWCVDSLRSKAPEIGYEHLLSNAYTCNFLAVMLGGILSVILYLNQLPHIAFFIAAAVSLFLVAFCLGEMEDEDNLDFANLKTISAVGITKRIGEIIGAGFQIFRQSPLILTLVLVFASYMLVLNIVDYLWPVYLRSKVPAPLQMSHWIGLIIVIQIVSALGSHGLSFWTRRWRKNNGTKTHNVVLRRIMIGSCLISAVPIILLSWLTSRGLDTFWYFAISILPVEFAYGIIAPCYETLVNNYIPDQHAQERATIMSFASLIRSLLVMLLIIPSVGSSGATTTIGWIIPASLLLVAALWGNRILKRNQNKVPLVTAAGESFSSESEGGEK